MTTLTEQYRKLEQDFFAYQKMLNEANKDLNKYYLENTKLKELLKECIIYVDRYVAFSVVQGNEERKVQSKELLTKINQVLEKNNGQI